MIWQGICIETLKLPNINIHPVFVLNKAFIRSCEFIYFGSIFLDLNLSNNEPII